MSLDTLFNCHQQAVKKVIYGQDEVVDFALAALFSSGHVLLEGPPGRSPRRCSCGRSPPL